MDSSFQGLESSESEDHGLRFMNEDWNESISNGQPFTLKWNESLEGISADLGVFRVAYPEDGMVVYELVSNLTGTMAEDQCVWTPSDLKNELYALWLTTTQDESPNWAISPPWTPKTEGFRWTAPIVIIPIVATFIIYALCLLVCLFYRRRKRRKAAAVSDESPPDLPLAATASRNPSVDSNATACDSEAELLPEPATAKKPETWSFLHLAGAAALAAREGSSRRPSDSAASTAETDLASDETAVESTPWTPLHGRGVAELGMYSIRRAEIRRDTRRQTTRATREALRPLSW